MTGYDSNKIDQWLHDNKENLIKDLIRMLSIKSISGGCSGDYPFGEDVFSALKEMLTIGQEHGFSVHNYDNYVGCLYNEDQKNAKTIGIWGHLDVVPEGEGWEYSPYDPVYKDGYIIGRGSNDNKGPCIAALYAAKCIRDLQLPTSNNIRLFYGTNEEKGMADIDYFVNNYSSELPDLNLVPDSNFPACIGEKGVLSIEISPKTEFSKDIADLSGGIAQNIVPPVAQISFSNGRREITAKGTSRHSASPEGAVNAIHELCVKVLADESLDSADREILSFIKLMTEDCFALNLDISCKDKLSGDLTCVGTMLKTLNRRPVLHLNIRVPILVNSKRVIDVLKNKCERNNFEISVISEKAPYYFTGEGRIIDELTDCFNRVSGKNMQPYSMSGGTYAGKLPNGIVYGMDAGFPAPSFLKPEHGGPHQPDEFISVDGLMIAVKAYISSLTLVKL